MNVYFEFYDSEVGKKYSSFGLNIPAKYCVRHCNTDLSGGPLVPHRLMHGANRVWQEDEHGVKYLKHRGAWVTDVQVDEKEFLWIKLSAMPV